MGNVDELRKKIAGEIVLSGNPGETIKKWRQLFKIYQTDLSKELGMNTSVISDYESGRRRSPGTKMIEKVVNALVEIDLSRGGKIIKEFVALYNIPDFDSFILLRKEFEKPVKINTFLKRINGKPCYQFKNKEIYGFSVMDSKKAIMNFSPVELSRLSSMINKHCIIFTNLQRGRSPLVAVRLTNIEPGMIVLHGILKIDDIALRIAKLENIPLALSYVSTTENLLSKLEKFK